MSLSDIVRRNRQQYDQSSVAKQRNKLARKGIAESFLGGFKSGRESTYAGMQGVRQAFNEATGDTADAAAARRARTEHLRKAAEAAQGTPHKLEDIHSLSDAARYAAGVAGSAAGSVIEPLAIAGGPRVLTAALGRAPKLLEKSGVARDAYKLFRNDKAAAGITGAATALYAGATEGGLKYGELRDTGASREQAAKGALTTGAGAALANAPAGLALGKAITKSGTAAKPIAGKGLEVAKDIGKTAAAEGLSEVGEDVASAAGDVVAGRDFKLDPSELMNSFVAGAIGGAAVGGTLSAAGHVLDPTTKKHTQARKVMLEASKAGREAADALISRYGVDDAKSLVSRMFDSTVSNEDAAVPLGMVAYYVDKKATGDMPLGSLVSEMASEVNATLDKALNDKLPVFDVANPSKSLEALSHSMNKAQRGYLMAAYTDGPEALNSAAAKLGFKVIDSEKTDENVTAPEPTGAERQYQVLASPTRLGELPEETFQYTANEAKNIAAKHGIPQADVKRATGFYGGDRERSFLAKVAAEPEKAVHFAANIGKRFMQNDVGVVEDAPLLKDNTGRFVARPALDARFARPMSEEEAVSFVQSIPELSSRGVTFEHDDNGNVVGFTSVAFPEMAARYDDNMREDIAAGNVQPYLKKAHDAYSSAVDRIIATPEVKDAAVVAKRGAAFGGEEIENGTPDATRLNKSTEEAIIEHVRRQDNAALAAAPRAGQRGAAEAVDNIRSGAGVSATSAPEALASLGTFTGKDTTHGQKVFRIPERLKAKPADDVPIKGRWKEVAPAVKELMEKYNVSHDVFSFADDDTYRAPALSSRNYTQDKRDTTRGVVWIYNPYDQHGAFNDPEYTKVWRIVHEIAHGITEPIVQEMFGDSRRLGALGKEVTYNFGRESKGKIKPVTTEPLTLREAYRAVIWEDVAFRIQRNLFEQLGVTISDADFVREYVINLGDAVWRTLSGDFSDPGQLGFEPNNFDSTADAYAYAVGLLRKEAKKRFGKNSGKAKWRGSAKDTLATGLPRMVTDLELEEAAIRYEARNNPSIEASYAHVRDVVKELIGGKALVVLSDRMTGSEYNTATRVIHLAMRKGMPHDQLERDLDHEIFHAMQHTVLRKPELDALRRAFRNGTRLHNRLLQTMEFYGDSSAAKVSASTSPDEAAAYAFEYYRSGRFMASGTVGKLFNRMIELLESVGNFLRGRGFVSARGVLRMVAEGEFANRELLAEPNELIPSAMSAEAHVMHREAMTKWERNMRRAIEEGELSDMDAKELDNLLSMMHKIGRQELTPAEQWRLLAHGGWREVMREARPNAVASFVDRMHGLVDIERRKNGKTKLHEMNSYMAATEAVHASKLAYYVLEHGPVEVNENGDIVPKSSGAGLYDIFAPVHDILDITLAYMVARRAARVGEQYGGYADEGIGLFTREEIDAAINAAESHPRFDEIKQAADAYVELNTSLLEAARKVGAIDADMFEMLTKYGDYVPFYRDLGDTIGAPHNSPLSFAANLGRLHNSNKQMANVFDNMHKNIYGLTQLIAHTRAMAAIDESLRKYDPDTGLPIYRVSGWKGEHALPDDVIADIEASGGKVTPAYDEEVIEVVHPIKHTSTTADEARRALKKAGVDVDKLPKEDAEKIVGITVFLAPDNPNIVSYMLDGKRQYRKVNDKLLLRAMKGMVSGRSNVSQPFKAASRLLVSTVTRFPGFWVANVIRDINATASIIDINLKVKDFIDGFKSAYTKDEWYKEALINGALPTAGHSRSGDMQEDFMTAITTGMRDRELARKSWLSPQVMLHKLVAKLDEAANVAENVSRLAVYRRAKDNGMSTRQAAFLARDILDFGKHGDNEAILRFIDTVPFANARIQGLARLGTGFKEHKNRAIRALAIMGVMSFALAMYNWNDERYRRLTDAQKDNYWHLFIGRHHIQIPKPFELGIVATAAERMAQFVFYDGDYKVLMQRGTFAVVNTLAMLPIPQLVQPFSEATFNRDFYSQRSIVPSYLESAKYKDQVSPYTSELAKGIAAVTNAILPETSVLSPIMSPMKIDHLITGYLGTFGQVLKDTSNRVVALVTGKSVPSPRLEDTRNVLGITRLYTGEWTHNTSDREAMYDMYRKIVSIEASLSVARKNRDYARMREIRSENAKYLKHKGRVMSVVGAVRNLNKQLLDIYRGKYRLSGKALKDKVERIYKRQNDLAASLRDIQPVFR